MEDAAFMGEVNSLGDDLEIGRSTARRQRTVADDLCQAPASHIIHREEMLAVIEADFVDRHNVRLLQAGGRGSFRSETLHKLRAGQWAGQQHLHCGTAIEIRLARLIADANRATRDFFQQFIVPKETNEWCAAFRYWISRFWWRRGISRHRQFTLCGA